MAEGSRRELSFPLIPHKEIDQKLEDYLRQLEELLRTILFGVESPEYPDLAGPEAAFTEGSVIFAGAGGGLSEDNDNFSYTLISKLLTVAFLSLGGANGSIWYSWDGKLKELPTRAMGMVLHDGGGGTPPYWDWVVLRSTETIITVSVSSSVATTRHETADHEGDQGAAAIGSSIVNNITVADAAWFDDQDYPELTAAETAAKVTMDGTSDQGDAAITIEIVTSVA